MNAGIVTGIVIGALVLVVGTTWLFGSRAKKRLAAQYPPPGQMVDVGGYQMHIHCRGPEGNDGGPTVVLDTGLGEPSLSWGSVPEQIAEFARVCTYDRAGLGWSERSPTSRLPIHIVEELHTLLTRAQVKPPYVLVGHSNGGLYAYLYADEYPGEVAGLVLVDSTHEDLDVRPPASMVKQGRMASKVAALLFGFFRMLNSIGLLALMPGVVSKLWFGPIPDENRPTHIGLACSGTRMFETMAREMSCVTESLRQARARRIRSVGDIPLVVLAGRNGEIPRVPEGEMSDAEKFDAAHIEMQTELAALSPQGRVVFTGASHYVQIDQPETVVDAVREVVEAVRAASAEGSQHA
jgi:pimeloyl-ACP methyl ester carboxylesterase